MSNNRNHHTGAVYLNGHWLDEAALKEEVFETVTANPLWFAEVNDSQTTIWAAKETLQTPLPVRSKK